MEDQAAARETAERPACAQSRAHRSVFSAPENGPKGRQTRHAWEELCSAARLGRSQEAPGWVRVLETYSD